MVGAGRWEVGYWTRDAERFGAYMAHRTASWERFLEAEGDRFPPELRELFEWVLSRLPDYWQRYLEPRFRQPHGLTLLHGDAYFC
jgi:hypothetical protein